MARSNAWFVLLGLIGTSGCNCGENPAGDKVDASPAIDLDSSINASDGFVTVTGDGGAPNTSVHVGVCPGCPCFPGTDCQAGGSSGSTPPCGAPATAPSLVYPPDQVLFPPNTNAIEIQFQPGTGNQLFEVDFQNATTDVRLITRCNPIANTRGRATGGCAFALDQTNWSYVASVNRGGAPVRVAVRATPDGQCASASSSIEMSFATEDLVGAIYYWQSATIDGVPGKTGGIFRYDFGRPDLPPEAFLESNASGGNRCVGCHFISRDGQRISFGTDDPDADDEYGDLSSRLMEVASRVVLSQDIEPGFRTFTRDHRSMLASDGRGRERPPALLRYDGDRGNLVGTATAGTLRPTQPDWAADDSKVVFVQPEQFLGNDGNPAAQRGDDLHFFGGSLFTLPWNGSSFGSASPLLMSGGENNFYPAYSPDGAFIVFNRAMGAAGVPTDAFSNPNARIWVMPAAGGAPVDLTRLNLADGISNSWPRWSQFVQHDRGHAILWLTFSSTRDYGLRVQNQDPAAVFCYPPESPENQVRTHRCPLVPGSCNCVEAGCTTFCNQPQIWMAAVEVDAVGGIAAGSDTSHPAFWLPFQEITAHNHIAQWVQSVPGHEIPDGGAGADGGGGPDPGSDGGTCGIIGEACGPGLPLCCSAFSCAGGQCNGF